jgi:predicted nucleotidyltransferase
MVHFGIAVHPEELAAFCSENAIRKLALFGSVLREDFGAESDVDVLVEFEPGKGAGTALLRNPA